MALHRIAPIVLALLGLIWPTLAPAQTRPKLADVGIERPASTIYIGNSFFYYNNSLHNHVLQMVRAADPQNRGRYRATSVTISGSGFGWHDVGNYFRPNAIGAYSFDQNNNVVFNKIDRLFDVAILMDCSQCPIHPTLKTIFREHAKVGSDAVRAAGARPAFFMSWAYADKPEMTAQLAEAYVQAGNDNDVFVIPVGLAFARSLDKRHPSLAGTYLAAATVFASLYKQSPVGNGYTAGLEAETAKFLQDMAWDTVQEFYKR